jgi:hypothetical protein
MSPSPPSRAPPVEGVEDEPPEHLAPVVELYPAVDDQPTGREELEAQYIPVVTL